MATPALPAGYQLDDAGGMPPLPAGYTADSTSKASFWDRFKDQPEKPGSVSEALQREGSAAAQAIVGLPKAVIHAFTEPPTDEERQQFGLDDKPDAMQRLALGTTRMSYHPAVVAGKWYGQAAQGKIPNAYEQALSVAPEAMGTAAGNVIGGKLMEMAPEAARFAADKAPAALEAVKNVTPKQAAQAVGGVSGGVAGHGTLSAPGAYYGAKGAGSFVESVLGKERANAPIFNRTPEAVEEPPQTGESIREGLNRANANQPPDAYPPGAEPPAPAQPDYEPLRPSVERIIDDIAPPSNPKNAAAKAQLEDLLRNAMGGQKTPEIVPGVPIKNQPAAQAAAGSLPEGFSPAESSALKGYKYNPESSEFEAMSKSGQHYVYGDVSPVQAEMFEKANSKGQAWNEIRNSNPLVAKVINGKRVPIAKTGVMVSPEQ